MRRGPYQDWHSIHLPCCGSKRCLDTVSRSLPHAPGSARHTHGSLRRAGLSPDEGHLYGTRKCGTHKTSQAAGLLLLEAVDRRCLLKTIFFSKVRAFRDSRSELRAIQIRLGTVGIRIRTIRPQLRTVLPRHRTTVLRRGATVPGSGQPPANHGQLSPIAAQLSIVSGQLSPVPAQSALVGRQQPRPPGDCPPPSDNCAETDSGCPESGSGGPGRRSKGADTEPGDAESSSSVPQTASNRPASDPGWAGREVDRTRLNRDHLTSSSRKERWPPDAGALGLGSPETDVGATSLAAASGSARAARSRRRPSSPA
jgi:hypothetical protein